jgi:[ribosomal protein S5]-alanine N-acetyltransferase
MICPLTTNRGITRINPADEAAIRLIHYRHIPYCLDEPAWGQGFATEAAGALLQWAFNTLDLNRVQSEADTRNAASDRVLHKLGFLREGTLRENCIVDGEVSNSWVYGLLRREWEQRQSRPAAD